MQSQVREAFRARLKVPTCGYTHRLNLIAWAYVRGKPYSFVEPRVRQSNMVPAKDVADQLVCVIGEGDFEAVQIWMDGTHGEILPQIRERPVAKIVVPKLYVIVRGDIPPGAVCSQAMHAAVEYVFAYPDQARLWHDLSNTVCILRAEGEEHINEIACEMDRCKKPHVCFHEPDMGGAMTAVAVGQDAAKLLRHLPLALS